MASRPELVEMCIELDIDHENATIEEMKVLVREEADKRFNFTSLWRRTGDSDISPILLNFLTKEYDYVLVDRNRKEVEI